MLRMDMHFIPLCLIIVLRLACYLKLLNDISLELRLLSHDIVSNLPSLSQVRMFGRTSIRTQPISSGNIYNNIQRYSSGEVKSILLDLQVLF